MSLNVRGGEAIKLQKFNECKHSEMGHGRNVYIHELQKL